MKLFLGLAIVRIFCYVVDETKEMEIGITGGVEDGVDNSGAAKECGWKSLVRKSLNRFSKKYHEFDLT